MISRRKPAAVLPTLIVAVIAISFAAIFFRKAAPTHPLVAAGTRLGVAAVLLLPWTLRAAKAGRLPQPVRRSALWGGVAYAIHFGSWVSSLTLTTVAASVTLVTATPLLLAVAGLVSGRDAPERRHWLALALAAAGVALIGRADFAQQGALAGDALALVGAAGMAWYMLLARRHGADLDAWAFSGVACAVGATLLLGACLLAEIPIAFAGAPELGYVVLAALLPQLVGHSLLTRSLRHVRPTTVAIATLGEPAGATLLGWWLLGEVPPGLTLLGCAVTVGAVALAIWREPAH